MLIKTLVVGQNGTNCYIVTDENSLNAAVIDPGDESGTILDYLEHNRLRCTLIMLTHGHYDHTLAAATVSEETGAPIYICEKDVNSEVPSPYFFAPGENTQFFSEGDVLTVGELEFRIIETPGHSPGSVVICCEDVLFVGDTLFRGTCGRTDLPGGDMKILLRSLRRLAAMYDELEGSGADLEVYPGHMEATTISREMRFNQYVKLATGA